MHIKQIIIRGFKTYREQVIIGPMSPKDNVFVGQNGHGKSNFFSAIMFVLSDKFSNIRQEEKQRLIHEGTGETQDSASVEIILDNSDSRLPIEKSTVSIKRVLEDKKDEFFIDGKHVTKADVNNLLESAGFSKSNPYYVVQQGRVASLAGMNESQCLDLLKEVAGTTVYDERKIESEKLMEETKRKREKIDELMARVKEKINELSGESEELKEYTKLEKERRAIEYILYKNHVIAAQEQIDLMEGNQSELFEKLNSLKLTANGLQEQIDNHDSDIASKLMYADKINASMHANGLELSKLQSDRAKIESKLLFYKDQRKSVVKDHSEYNAELKSIREQTARLEAELKIKKPDFQKVLADESKFAELINSKNQRRHELYCKQGSNLRFKSLKEKEAYWTAEIKKLEDLRKETSSQISKTRSEIASFTSKSEEASQKIPGVTSKIYDEKNINDKIIEQIIQIKQQRAENATNLASLRHEEESLVSQQEQTESKLTQISQRLKILMSGGFFLTIERLKLECRSLVGFYGVFIDLIQIPPKFQTCADIIGRNKVFSIIVDTFETAKKVLDANSRLGGGSINIYPLDWVKEMSIKDRTYPTGSDSIALIKQIKTKEGLGIDVAPLVKYVFGKCLLVRNQDVANRYAKEFKLHCITPDGQMVCAGAYLMRAGFHDAKKERIRNYADFASVRENQLVIREKLSNLLKQKDSLLTKDSALMRKILEAETAKDQSNAKINNLKSMETELKARKNDSQKAINDLERALTSYSRSLSDIEKNLEISREELSRKNIQELTAAETQELEQLMGELQGLEDRQKVLISTKRRSEDEIRRMEEKILVYLPERERKLEDLISDCTMLMESRDEFEVAEDFRQISKQIEYCEINMHKNNQDLMEIKTQIREVEEKIQGIKETQQRIRQESAEYQIEIEKIALKLTNLVENKESYIKKMGSLGSLPAEEHDRFKSESSPALKTLLEKNSRNIKKYQHVNKRALEQYTKYSEKLDNLTEKLLDLEKSDKSITELLLHLETVKDEAIIRTFRSVAQHFSEVFHEVVPQGKGRLKMVKGDGEGVNKYVGVSISVAFSRTEESVYKMQQLSGGQKTAVAIALVIAIQRADPAPFYLFDELDAALDSQLRSSLAAVISRSCEKAQFIMTTFKPELCKTATKLFEVKFKNKASTIRLIDRNRALEVIQQNDGPV